MKNVVLSIALLSSCLLFSNCEKKNETVAVNSKPETTAVSTADTKIQVALLLDTSSSMNGLIEQAKSRLWNIVNTLTTLKYEGKNPEIQISL